jgi:hypothetical protein
VFFCHFPSVAQLARIGPGESSALALGYVPYDQATQMNYESCVPLMDAYDPRYQVVVIVCCTVNDNYDGVYKGRIMSVDSHLIIPDVFDATGQVIQSEMQQIESNNVETAPRCNWCGADEGFVPMKCSVCRAAIYCNKECQRKDWKKHKMECAQVAKAIRKDGKHFVRENSTS